MKTLKKTMLSTVSFLLSLTIMLAVFVIPVYADEPEPEDVTIHYYNENNWQSPYLYYYADNNNPVAWPGVAMTSDGDNWYSYTVSNFDEIRIIFSNNGSNQYPAQNEPGILVSGEKWFKNGNLYSQDPDTFNITVHYYNGNGWSSPYIYYYDTNNSPVSWPGTAMTSDGNGWYSYVINGFDSARVIFSDNGSNQTPAQNEPGYLVSGEKWFVGSTAYDSEPDGITVHFFNYNNWSNVNIYYYIGELTGSQWTGVPMNPEGDGWYSYKLFGFDEARVIFNNGNGTQIPAPMQEGFYVDEDSWYRNGTWTDSRPEDIVVYFCKPTGWSTPNIYFYLNNNDTGPSWPGTAMTEISDGWYAATIAKYSSAKVMFNDGTNQIPSQNQPGLDAEGIMWYKNGIWCDSETDTDEDELLDYMELLLGTNINNTDSDSDGLPDGFEALTLGTDPSLADTDDNNVSDAYEDADSDDLTNLREYQLGTDPTVADTDGDGLADGAEVNTYLTDPTDEDTDGDGASDGWEVEHSFDPLVVNSSFEVTLSLGFRDDDVAPSVSIELDGDQADSLQIEQITDNRYFLEETVGIIGAPYEFDVSGTFDSADISFEFDSDLLLDEDFDPVICWFDEENQKIEFLETTITGNVASAEVEHFSIYMLIDSQTWSGDHEWNATYTVDYTYNNVELVVLIDDSVNMSTKDPSNLRLAVAQVLCSYLPAGTETALFQYNTQYGYTLFDTSTNKFFTFPSNYFSYMLSNNYNFQSNGTTSNLYSAIEDSVSVFTDTNPYTSRIVLVIGDGEDPDTENRSSALEAVEDAAATVLFLGVGEDKIIPWDFKSFAAEANGHYLNLGNYQDVSGSPWYYADVNYDYDNDGLPDEFEGTITLFNGKPLYSNPLDPDTDDDGLPDGQEITFRIRPGAEPNEVYVFVWLHSDPSSEDSDGDGDLDDIDPEPLKYQLNGYFIEQLQRLYDLAISYQAFPDVTGLFNTNVEDWLTFMFIRSFCLSDDGQKRYSGLKWALCAGDIDDRFIEYVKTNDRPLYDYFADTPYIYANAYSELSTEYWGRIDLYHMAGTISALIYSTQKEIEILSGLTQFLNLLTTSDLDSAGRENVVIIVSTFLINNVLNVEKVVDDMLGWAGDLRTFMDDVIENNDNVDVTSYNSYFQEFVSLFGTGHFSYEDLYGDVDANNIFNMDNSSNMVESFSEYYSQRRKIKNRFHLFIDNRTVQDFKDYVDPYVQSFSLGDYHLFLHKHAFNQDQVNAARDAFTTIMFNLMSDE